jgi:DNA-binding transcriptional LysR family regulator
MTYEQIETFLTVVTYGNISAAANYLYISQSTVSTRLQQLENELGTTLILRKKGHRSTELTNYGLAFIPIASQWAALWKDTVHIKTLANIQTLHIASVDAINNYTLVPFYQQQIESHPNTKLSINTHHSNEIYSLVENRAADIGFVFSNITYPDVITRPVYRELMYLLCSEDSPYRDDMPYGELDVSNEVYLEWGLDLRQWHDSRWAPSHYPLIQVNTVSMLEHYLTESGRWAIAPMSVIQRSVRTNPCLTFHTLKHGCWHRHNVCRSFYLLQ